MLAVQLNKYVFILNWKIQRNNQQETSSVLGKSETDEIINSITEHYYEHNKPKTNQDFGYYIAGLIEGDGYIGKRGFEILFHKNDVNNAFEIKKRIGYGSVSKVKNKNAYKLSIFHQDGVSHLWNLINGKFQGQYKIDQAKKNGHQSKFTILPPDNSNILDNYWLAGFADADGNFSIFIANSKTHKLGKNVRLPFRFTQKYPDLLYKIQNAFNGGVLYHNVSKHTSDYRYSTVNFKRAIEVENYFNKFHLQNNMKYLRYCYWKKALVIVKTREHLNQKGLEKLYKIKEKINKLQ